MFISKAVATNGSRNLHSSFAPINFMANLLHSNLRRLQNLHSYSSISHERNGIHAGISSSHAVGELLVVA